MWKYVIYLTAKDTKEKCLNVNSRLVAKFSTFVKHGKKKPCECRSRFFFIILQYFINYNYRIIHKFLWNICRQDCIEVYCIGNSSFSFSVYDIQFIFIFIPIIRLLNINIYFCMLLFVVLLLRATAFQKKKKTTYISNG